MTSSCFEFSLGTFTQRQLRLVSNKACHTVMVLKIDRLRKFFYSHLPDLSGNYPQPIFWDNTKLFIRIYFFKGGNEDRWQKTGHSLCCFFVRDMVKPSYSGNFKNILYFDFCVLFWSCLRWQFWLGWWWNENTASEVDASMVSNNLMN